MDINLESFSFGVNVSGAIQSEKGLGTAVRSDIYSLRAGGIPFAVNNSADSGSINNDKSIGIFSGENPYLFNLIHINPNTIVKLSDGNMFLYEHLAKKTNYLSGHYNIGYWVWELDKIPEEWLYISGFLDEVWTPSDFSFQALSRDLQVPVVRMPHCIYTAENSFKGVLKRSDLSVPDDVFLFLFIFDAGSYIERKNPFAVINAFKKAFSPDEKVMLFIKTSHTEFNKPKFYELLRMSKGYNVTVSDSVLTSDQTYSLISLSDCYVSLHRSEGFGLTMAEAMAQGKPVIATGYSGNMDFMNKSNSYPVDYRLVKLESDYGVYKKGNFWAETDIDETGRLMRHVFENRIEGKSVGERGKKYIKKFYSPTFVGNMYKKRLNKIMRFLETSTANINNKTGALSAFYGKPLISIVMPVYNTPGEYLEKAIKSVINQKYRNWELCIADDASTKPHVREILERYLKIDNRIKAVFRKENGHISEASNSALELVQGEYVALMDHDDELTEDALYSVVLELNKYPEAALIYSDEDRITPDGNYCLPYFKSDFSYDLFLEQNYVIHLGVYKTEVVKKLGGFRKGFEGSQDYDLTLRVLEQIGENNVRHIPRILYHWRYLEGSVSHDADSEHYSYKAAIEAVQDHLNRVHPTAKAVPAPNMLYQRVIWPVKVPNPLASIIIPTRDKVEFLKPCIESVLNKSDYPNYEIIIVDNGSRDKETLNYFKELHKNKLIRIIHSDTPFNYSFLNNFAVEHANGDILILLNNDTEIISPKWIEEMAGRLSRPEVGIVGGRLLSKDNNTLQHAGVVIDLETGEPFHLPRGISRDDPGYFGYAMLDRDVLAVTGAALAIKRTVFEDVGGFDEKLPENFNDVDLCLKVRRKGYKIIYTPYAELYHHEKKTRSNDNPGQFRFALKYLKDKWGDALFDIHYIHPNLLKIVEDALKTCKN